MYISSFFIANEEPGVVRSFSFNLPTIFVYSSSRYNHHVHVHHHALFVILVSYDNKEMTLSWHKDDPVAVSDKIQIPSYTLTDYKHYSSVDEFTTGMMFR